MDTSSADMFCFQIANLIVSSKSVVFCFSIPTSPNTLCPELKRQLLGQIYCLPFGFTLNIVKYCHIPRQYYELTIVEEYALRSQIPSTAVPLHVS